MNPSIDKEIKALILRAREEPSPGELSEIGVQLSSYYATLAERVADIETFMPERWLELRQQDGVKSDGMADKLWDASTEGKARTKLRAQLRYIEKVVSSINRRLRIQEGEAMGRF